MNWLNQLRASIVPVASSTSSASASNLAMSLAQDPAALLEVYCSHWAQAVAVIRRYSHPNSDGLYRRVSGDDVVEVFRHFDTLAALLLAEVNSPQDKDTVGEQHSIGPCLDYLFTENIFEVMVNFCLSPTTGEYLESCKVSLLKIYETIVSQSRCFLLVHKPILNPMLLLLDVCNNMQSVECEKHIVVLLNQICTKISGNSTLLDFFFDRHSDDGPPKFTVFTFLIDYLYREGNIGQLARDAILLILTVSRDLEIVGTFIADRSEFCPVVATGLSGLYSMLPRKLNVVSDDWYRLTPADVETTPYLSDVYSALEFCNAVIQVGHKSIQGQLLDYVYQGFLVPVMTSALLQTSSDEIVAATAYFDLFLRTVSEPSFLRVFLIFLCDQVNGVSLLDTLVTRISSNSRVCLTTLSLFRTLLELNCEDIMYELVLKYLVPCVHIDSYNSGSPMVSMQSLFQSSNLFLSLIPTCCRSARLKFAQEIQDIVFDICCNSSNTNSGAKLADVPALQNASALTAVDVAGEAASYFENEEFGEKEIEKNFYAISSLVSYIDAVEKPVKDNYSGCVCWALPYDGVAPDPVVFREPEPVLSEPVVNEPVAPETPREAAIVATETGFSRRRSAGFDRRSSMRRSARPNSYFGVRHSSALYGATSKVDLSLGNTFDFNFDELFDDFEFDDELLPTPAKHEQKQVTGASCSEGTTPATTPREEKTPSGASIVTSPFYKVIKGGGGGGSAPVDYFKLAFDEDATSVANNQYISDSQDDSDFAQSPNGQTPAWTFVGWSQIQDLDTFIQVIGRVPASRSVAKCSLEENFAFIEDKFKAICESSSVQQNNKMSASVDGPISEVSAQPSTSEKSCLEPGNNAVTTNGISSLHYYAKDSVLLKGPTVSRYIGNVRSPNIGPFLSILLHKLENLTENSLFINLQLTGLVSRLAYYPQPLIISFLLNSSLKLQPTIRPLFQIINSIRNRIDSHICSLQNFEMFWLRAQKYLIQRSQTAVYGGFNKSAQIRGRRSSVISDSNKTDTSIVVAQKTSTHGHKTSGGVAQFLQQLQKPRSQSKFRTRSVDANSQAKNGSRQRSMTHWSRNYDDSDDPVAEENTVDLQKTKNLVYSAIVFEEFLKELAAIAIQHAALHKPYSGPGHSLPSQATISQ